MEYWEMDIWKVNWFNFLNKEVEEFIYFYIFIYVYSYMFHNSDAWKVNVVVNNEQSLKITLAFAATIGAVVSF